MKIRCVFLTFSPLVFFLAISGDASAQIVGVNHLNNQRMIQGGGLNRVHPGHHQNHPGHVNHLNHAAHLNHHPVHLVNHPVVVHGNHFGYCQPPAIFVGPQVVRYSNSGGQVIATSSGYGSSLFSTPGVTRVHTGSRGPFRSGTYISSNSGNVGLGGAGPVSPTQPLKSQPRPDASSFMNLGAPVGGPVGTWYEDAKTPGNVYQYTVRADGKYEMHEFAKDAAGVMKFVTKIPAPLAFTFEKGQLELDPDGAYEEGPYEVSMSANAMGQTRVTLKDGQGGLRVWRDAP